MSRKLTPARLYGSPPLVIVSIHVTRDMRELLELSAERSGLTRSAEVNRLLLIALGRAPSGSDSELDELRGHLV